MELRLFYNELTNEEKDYIEEHLKKIESKNYKIIISTHALQRLMQRKIISKNIKDMLSRKDYFIKNIIFNEKRSKNYMRIALIDNMSKNKKHLCIVINLKNRSLVTAFYILEEQFNSIKNKIMECEGYEC